MGTIEKKCKSCDSVKPFSDFYNAKKRKDGKMGKCKVCSDVDTLRWRAANKDKVVEQKREWGLANSDKKKANRDRDADKRNRDSWNAKNPDKVLRDRINWTRKKTSDPRGKLERNVSRAVHKCITSGSKSGSRTFDLLGYTSEDLANHLESLFRDGMSWENQGKGGWHIDHIIPLSAFNYDSPDQIDFGRAWALSNLQPLWESENCSKGSKLCGEFQPSLALS